MLKINRRRLQVSLVTLLTLALCPASHTEAPPPASGAASTVGTAVGTGLSAFMSTAFPVGTIALNLVQSWLSQKLNGKQQKDVTTGADKVATNAKKLQDPATAQKIKDLQTAAQTLQFTSVAIFHATNATVLASSMLATLDSVGAKDKIPVSELGPKRDDLKTELSSLDPNGKGTFASTRQSITDTAALGALQQLDQVTPTNSGPFQTIQDNLKDTGDLAALRKALERIAGATSQFANLATVLLGSTGSEIASAVNDFKQAGGASSLDKLTDDAVKAAQDKIPPPTKRP